MTFGLSVRTRLLLATVGVVSLALVIGVTAFNVFVDRRLGASATAAARADADAELSSLRATTGRVDSSEGPEEHTVSTLTWVYEGTRAIDAPRSSQRLSSAARTLVGA